eukprot:11207342-Karenia_brevis.AAC.1
MIGAPISPHVPIMFSINQKPFLTLTMQQVKPAEFGEDEEEGIRLSWDDAESYMEEHGISGDKGCLLYTSDAAAICSV